ncbi:recombination regulator RecX [Vulcaniibacterium tengchongense]|uniref:Regulatory protein RecX n=1 Tax=Vulcaniibacterium tengchongense TaxID=1273429 RepID=A0A3N4VI33_9GAMM|nr:recombination regulator RecX [Vulcaniibacterium tengchongense]RPE81343.1 regulatory protein [Vulcaniibacterium tengchongense]
MREEEPHEAGAGAGEPPRRRKPREQTPVQRALGLLVRREHSRRELTRKLQARGLDPAAASAAVETLAGQGWQDDARFAESLVRSRAGAGYGPVRIRAELRTHGIDGEALSRALASFEGDWSENARDLVRRRFGPALADDPALQRKAADFLLRRGFDAASVRAATRCDFDDELG